VLEHRRGGAAGLPGDALRRRRGGQKQRRENGREDAPHGRHLEFHREDDNGTWILTRGGPAARNRGAAGFDLHHGPTYS
jgi:hypothetical protein